MSPRKLIAGNWKMHGSRAALAELDAMAQAARGRAVDVALCVPFPLIAAAADHVARFGNAVAIGAQDCHASPHGPHTGCVSATMLAETGATLCIVGHSERRTGHGETDAEVRAKAEAVITAGMTAIVCVGERRAHRDAGEAVAVVEAQLAGSLPLAHHALVVGYEPVWAVGSGRTPTADEIAAVHAAIRRIVGPQVRILYGGSVTADNAAALLHIPDVDGALVGGASLTAARFVPIIDAAVL